MTQRNWNNNGQDWDPMRDDYNNSTYDAQYPDDNAGGGVQLDQCRLYLTNIPKTLNEDGLRNAFSKYGTIVEAYLSKEPHKRYGLVSYETSGEAKLALMKLNRTEPLNLNICIAHKKKNDRKQKEKKERSYTQDSRDDTGSQSSRGINSRKQDDCQLTINGEEENDNLIVDYEELGDNLDPELHMELVQLKMEHLKLQEAQLQCKQRMLLLNSRVAKKQAPLGSNRCILPDGRIVVRNVNDRASEVLDKESYSDGDASRPPALTSVSSRACVSCGARAEAFCARCEVTAYCGVRCQRRDWAERHRAVCHNLARLANADSRGASTSLAPELNSTETVIPPAAPLRRPHSPANQKVNRNTKPDEVDRQKFHPPGANARTSHQNSNHGRPAFNNKINNPRDNNFNNRNNRPQNKTPQNTKSENRGLQDNKAPNNPHNRSPVKKPQSSHQAEVFEEEWTIGDNKESTESPKPYPPMRQPHEVKTKAEAKPKPEPIHKAEVKSVASSPGVKASKLQPASLENVTPAKKIVPKKCVAELLSVGDVAMVSVDALASECRSGCAGYVCLALNEAYGESYEALCGAYATACEADTEVYKPNPGQSFSYLDPTDGGWYRARCLGPSICALLDVGRLATLKPEDTLKKLPQEYAEVPEFCCLLKADNVKIGDNLKCTVTLKLPRGCNVSIEDAESGAPVGEGEICRWLPEVEIPAPVSAPIGGAVAVPEVPRPDLKEGSRVLLVEASDLNRVLVRGANSVSQRRYDSALHGALLYGQGATPLDTPPQKGQLVIGRFSDGLHYRALCKRTNVKQNKYLLEYVEYGNLEITKLEDIYPCPSEFDLNALPAEASVVSLQCQVTALTAPAKEYIEQLKDSAVELLLSICSGAGTEPSGAVVALTVADTKESVNKKLEELCTPEWKKMEQSGVDVVESAALMYSDLEYLELPAGGCEIEVLDISSLEGATVSGYKKGESLAKTILEELPQQLEAYCNSELGREPYLPKFEELCIAQCPPYPQWFRAVLCEQVSGAGGAEARVCYVDYGNVECVAITALRKMLPEFVRGKPALAAHLEIRNFPKEPTEQMLAKALQHMNINEEGRGCLKVSRCQKIEEGMYIVDAPDLIKAMMA